MSLAPAFGCVSRGQLVSQIARNSTESIIRTPGALPVSTLGQRTGGFALDVRIIGVATPESEAPIPRRWTSQIGSYEYRLLDRYETELLVYHHHPAPFSLGPNHPHLHVSAALTAQVDAQSRREIGLDKLHLATGQVTLAAFVRMLITEFGAAPLRDDWRDILDRADATMAG